MNSQDHAYALPVGYMLEEYRIERLLGSGGFGITYLARDTHLDKAVAVKEYLPNDFAVRDAGGTVGPKSSAEGGNYQWGLARFLEEAQVLAGFDHAHINRVHRRLQAHGTAYLVLEYISGETLSARLRRTKVLSPEAALRLFRELLSGLEVVHRQGYVHRDIKPGNILFREDGASVLLDFGAARQLVGQRSRSITSILTPGYAPIEQYDSKAEHVGPWSDFYALGVTVYRCVTGVNEGALLDAVARAGLERRGEVERDMRPAEEVARGGYDRRLLRAIDGCMKVDERERPQDVGALRALLGERPAPRPGPVPPNPPPPPPPRPDGDKGKPLPPVVWAAVGAVGVLLLVLVLPWRLSSPPVNPAPVSAPSPAPAEEATPRGRVAERAVGEDGRDDSGEALAPPADAPAPAPPPPPPEVEAPGSLVLDIEPSDARVILPDIEPRYRPGLELSAGEYRVIVRREGYEEFTDTVRIESGQRTSKSIVLVEQPGRLVLDIEPSDARVILPDIELRYRRGMELPAGDYRVVVRQPGYEEFTDTVRIESGARTTRSIVLRREAPARAVGEVFQDTLKSGGEGPVMVVLPTGSFRMGSPSGEEGRYDNEGPVRTVTIGKRIAMGRYEVTVGEFRRFVTASGYRTEAERNAGGKQGCQTLENTTRDTWDWTPGRSWSNLEYTVEEDQPVVCVSWNDARRYIEWLNEETGGGYRLPSEAEWEYAVRAGSVSRYHFGDDESKLCDYGNVADMTRLPDGSVWTNKVNCSDGTVYPTAVGSYKPNPFGLYDMHGNVWEWVADCSHDNYEGAPTDGSAWTTGCDGGRRAVVRGGAWSSVPRVLRSADRSWGRPSLRALNSGFRLVQDLNP